MNIELSFLKSKVAKRIFSLLLVASLLPIFLLAFFSFNQVDTLITDISKYQLRQEAKRYGLSLLERLILAEQKLDFIGSIYSDGSHYAIPKTDNDLFEYFKSINLINTDQAIRTIYGPGNKLPELLEQQKHRLHNGESVIVISNHNHTTPQVWLFNSRLHDTHSGAHITAGLLDSDYLWGLSDNIDYQIGICTRHRDAGILFCTEPSLASTISNFLNQYQSNEVQDNFDVTEQNAFVTSWDLFLDSRFFTSDITIFSISDTLQATRTSQFLKKIFWFVTALTIAVIIFFSLLLIRRNMIPLEDLMEGVKRISNNDFSHKVRVRGDDEFGSLAHSFNTMSAKLENSVEVLKTLSEIDRLILSNIKLKEIIKITITRLSNVIDCLTTSVVLIESNNKIKIYYEYGKDSGKIVSIENTTSDQHISRVFASSTLLVDKTDKELPSYVGPLLSKGAEKFLLVPVSSQTKPSAIIVFAYDKDNNPTHDDYTYSREFADRFGVAVSNVRWKTKLFNQANYDNVTSLPNRHKVKNKLNKAISSARASKKRFGVLFLDLDRFKHVNDSLGHSSGDLLLKLIAERINSILPTKCLLGRLGGDEFVILTDQFRDYHQIDTLIKRILDSLKHPFMLSDQNIHIGASIGVAVYPDHGDNHETLLKNADSAMYYAKSLKNGGYEYFNAERNAVNTSRLAIESALHQAIQLNEFELYYQPQVHVKTGLIVGAEALIRWNHPTKGRVSPAEFIPIAEQNGLIIDIGDWVLQTACSQNRSWQTQGLPAICMSVNLTARQFTQPNLVRQVKDVLNNNQLDVKYLDLEITETAAMVDISRTLNTLNQLSLLGINISVDDYGTGYSSLSYLKDFPVHRLKIDQSFVRNLIKTPKNRAIIKSTITLGHQLNMQVIAEGVENPEELAFIHAEGCDIYQGYLFSPPVSASEFTALLKKQLNKHSNIRHLNQFNVA